MKISRLFVYPVKSCAGIEVDALSFDENGPQGDRRFVIASPEGDFLTQRELPAMARIQPRFERDELVLSYPERAEIRVSMKSSSEPQRVRIWSDEVTGVDCGDNVIIINAEKVKVTGNKEENKKYWHHTGFPGGQKEANLKRMRLDHPDRIISNAVKGMLPHNRLGRQLNTHLKVYSGTEHPHAAQKPQTIQL